MKKNRKIYSWLLTPVLACLMLAQASCSNDIAENTPEQVPGGTYLTIVTRGINTTDNTEYEDYVKTLRVIAFKNGVTEPVLNELLEEADLPDQNNNGTVDNTDDDYVDLTDQAEKFAIGSGGGTYTFYFIANEEGHTTDGTTTLQSVLEKENITVDALESQKVQFTEDEIKAPTTVGANTTYMLMSKKLPVYIDEGVDQTIEVELIRALAKAQLVIRSEEDITVSASLPKAAIPDNYYLMSGKTVTNSTYLASDNILLDETTEAPFDDKASSEDNKYVSQVVYLPERAATDLTSALNYSITITDDSNSPYTAPIANGEEEPVDYDIIRNNAYTTICTYDPAKPATLTLTYTVQSWGQGGGEHTFN